MPCLQLSERSKASNDPVRAESSVGGMLVCWISREEQPLDNLTVKTLRGVRPELRASAHTPVSGILPDSLN